ncbi:MAG: hypothetical protein ACXV2C_07940 [Candidatus Bathyarchaeia archaeon]
MDKEQSKTVLTIFTQYAGNWNQIYASDEFKAMGINHKRFKNHVKSQQKRVRKQQQSSINHNAGAIRENILSPRKVLSKRALSISPQPSPSKKKRYTSVSSDQSDSLSISNDANNLESLDDIVNHWAEKGEKSLNIDDLSPVRAEDWIPFKNERVQVEFDDIFFKGIVTARRIKERKVYIHFDDGKDAGWYPWAEVYPLFSAETSSSAESSINEENRGRSTERSGETHVVQEVPVRIRTQQNKSGKGRGKLQQNRSRDNSPRTKLLQEHDDLLLKDAVSSSEITSQENWEKAKQRIQASEQQMIRNQRIEKALNEKKELIATVKAAEAEKKEVATTGLSFQAMSLAMMGRMMHLLDPADTNNAEEVKELKTKVEVLETDVKDVKSSLSLLLNHFNIQQPQ